MKLTIGSLFSSYGGLDMAVESVTGAVPAWFCEYDDAPARILAHRWPNVPNYRDVTTVDWDEIPPVDILTGGYPCQPFSAAGQRKGTGDDRHLWPYVRQAIRRIRPRLTLLENVAGHRSLGFDTVLADLAEDGLHARWCSLRASDVGAPHHRERLFIAITPPDADRIRVQAGGQSQPITTEESRTGSGEHTFPDNLIRFPTPNASDGSGGGQPMSQRGGHSRQLIDAVLDLDSPHLPTPRASDPANASSHASPGFRPPLGEVVRDFLPTPTVGDKSGAEARSGPGFGPPLWEAVRSDEFGKYAPVVARWEAITGVPAPAPTELNRNGKPRLNAAFAEWIMGLPIGWITAVPGVSRAQQLKAIGNGVCPPQATVALAHLLGVPA